MTIYYTGIGSRNVPNNMVGVMHHVGSMLAEEGLVLRSGAADGSDAAFEFGCDRVSGPKEIYLPYKNFRKHISPLYTSSAEAYTVAGEVWGKSWDHIQPYIKDYMARNCHQVLGGDMNTPSEFVICYTNDGCETEADRVMGKAGTGGTGQAIALADRKGIPIFNLKNIKRIDDLMDFLGRRGYVT